MLGSIPGSGIFFPVTTEHICEKLWNVFVETAHVFIHGFASYLRSHTYILSIIKQQFRLNCISTSPMYFQYTTISNALHYVDFFHYLTSNCPVIM